MIALRFRTALWALVLGTLVSAQPSPQFISWEKTLAGAMAKGKESDRLIMVCINAKYVDGR